MLEKRGVWDVEEEDHLMLEKSVRMDVGAYRIDVFLRISLQLDDGVKRMINVVEKVTDEFCTKWDC